MHINVINAFFTDPDSLMIAQCLMIPIDKYHHYYGGVDAELLVELDDFHSPNMSLS